MSDCKTRPHLFHTCIRGEAVPVDGGVAGGERPCTSGPSDSGRIPRSCSRTISFRS